MRINEKRTVTYDLNDITREEFVLIIAALSLYVDEGPDTEHDNAKRLLNHLTAYEPAGTPPSDPQSAWANPPTPQGYSPGNDVAPDAVSDDDPRPRTAVPHGGGGEFRRVER